MKVVADIGKVQIKLTKKVLGLWPTFGTISKTKNIQTNYWKCEVLGSYDATYNVKFLLLKYDQNVYNHVYPGQHVYVKAIVNGIKNIFLKNSKCKFY